MILYIDNTTSSGDNGVTVIGHGAITYHETCPNVPDDLDMPEEIIAAPKQTFERAPVRPRFMQRPVNARAKTNRLRLARGPM